MVVVSEAVVDGGGGRACEMMPPYFSLRSLPATAATALNDNAIWHSSVPLFHVAWWDWFKEGI